MGAFNGSISYALYHVDGEPLERGFRERFMTRIQEFAFRELTPDSEDDISSGWCVCGQLLNTDFNLANVFYGDYVCLGLRTDRWSLPSALFKARFAEATENFLKERGKAKASRLEKDLIRDAVTLALKKQLIPATGMIDMVWHTERNELRFWTHSKTVNEQFIELWESTFELRLVGQNPYIAAVSCGLSDEATGKLGDVQIEPFVLGYE